MYQCYRGHASHVTKLRFTHDHRFLISLGGADKCVIQWRHDVEDLDSSSDDEDHLLEPTASSQPSLQQQLPRPPPQAVRRQQKGGPSSSSHALLLAAALDASDLVQVDPATVHRTPLQVGGREGGA